MNPRPLLSIVLKIVAVAIAAGVVGIAVGVGLAKLTGSGGDDDAATAQTTSGSPVTTPGTTPTAPTAPAERSRTTRVQILSAVLYPARTASGRARQRARVVVRVRVTSRSVGTLTPKKPQLLVDADRVSPNPRTADLAAPLLEPLAPAASATGELRFETAGAVTQRLTTQQRARLTIAGRTVSVPIRISGTRAPSG